MTGKDWLARMGATLSYSASELYRLINKRPFDGQSPLPVWLLRFDGPPRTPICAVNYPFGESATFDHRCALGGRRTQDAIQLGLRTGMK